MPKREDWIKCIAAPDRPAATMCGRIDPLGWKFVDLDHANAAEREQTRLQPCIQCLVVANHSGLVRHEEVGDE